MPRTLTVVTVVAIGLASAWRAHERTTNTPAPRSARCTMMPAPSLLLLRVEQDTTLPFAGVAGEALSYTTRPLGRPDTISATSGTLMPAGRVRLLDLDRGTRTALQQAGIRDTQPTVFLRAAPYGADCRTVRWTDTTPWIRRGEIGFARAVLTPREQWIDGTPVFAVPETWSYPYPRQRGLLPYGRARDLPVAPAAAVFSLAAAFDHFTASPGGQVVITPDSVLRERALAWAAVNPASRELEPLRTSIRNAVLQVSRTAGERHPSRARGSYAVTMITATDSVTWFFRTTTQPAYSWQDADTVRSIADLLSAPYAAGYQLVGYGATAADSLPAAAPRGSAIRQARLVWLAVGDQPQRPDYDTITAWPGELQFKRVAAPPAVWNALDPYVRPLSALSRAFFAVPGREITRDQQQPQLPITLRLGADGTIHADTLLVRGTDTLRLRITRLDTVSVARPF